MLGDRLKKLRAERGWTQTELAERAGVSQQLITKIERGTVRESRKLPQLAAAFGLTVEQFLAGEPSRRAATHLRWPFRRLRPADFETLSAQQVADIEDLVGDRIAWHKARNGPRPRRKSRAA